MSSLPHYHVLSGGFRVFLTALIIFNLHHTFTSYPVQTGQLLTGTGFLFLVFRCVTPFSHPHVMFGLCCSFTLSFVYCDVLSLLPHFYMDHSVMSLVVCRLTLLFGLSRSLPLSFVWCSALSILPHFYMGCSAVPWSLVD